MNVELTEYPYFAGTAMTPDSALLDRLATDATDPWLRSYIVGLTDGRPIALPTFGSTS